MDDRDIKPANTPPPRLDWSRDVTGSEPKAAPALTWEPPGGLRRPRYNRRRGR